jgi:hypothetical protein
MPIVSSVFPGVSCNSFKSKELVLRFVIHFEFILLQGERHASSFSFLQSDIQFLAAVFVEETYVVFIQHMFWELSQKLGM